MFAFPPADRPTEATTFVLRFFKEGVPESSFSNGKFRLDLRTPA